jgi:hypothetical protein
MCALLPDAQVFKPKKGSREAPKMTLLRKKLSITMKRTHIQCLVAPFFIRFSKTITWKCILPCKYFCTLFANWTNLPAYTVKKVCGSWNQKLYIGEYSEIYSLKLKNSGIYNLRFAPS